MKKLLCLVLAAALCISAAACSPKAPATKYDSYSDLIGALQTEAEKESFPVVASKDDEMASGIFAMLGIEPTDVAEFAAACSFMNVNAYCVAIFKPADGKAAGIESSLKNYVELTKSNMENYLPDQFEIAKKASVETLKTGEVIIVMGEGSDETLEKIKSSLQ